MFESQRKSTGTGYTATVGFLIIALLFIPAILLVSRPASQIPLILGAACSALCISLAWITWKKTSRLSIPSIAASGRKSK